MAFIGKIENQLRLILFVFAFLAYANTLNHDFAWDDSIVITENPRVQQGIKGIPDLFLKYNTGYKSDKYGYRPIVLVSYAIEYSIFKNNPKPGHFTNVFLFSLLCVLLYNLLRKLFPDFKNAFAFFSCLIFCSHPIHTEVVANIKSRDEIFALLFILLSCRQLFKYSNAKKILNLFYASVLFILAFLSKESSVIFLFIIPLFYIQTNTVPKFKTLLKPLLFLGGLLFLSVIIVQLSASSQLGSNLASGTGIFHESGILGNSFFYTAVIQSKLANAFLVLFLYLKNFFIPIQQLYYYGYNQIPLASWGQWQVILSLLIHFGGLILAIIYFKKNTPLSFAILFYFISISIYTHLFRTLADTMADRFLFVPSIALSMILVITLSQIFKLNLKNYSVHDIVRTQTLPGARNFKFLFICMVCLCSLKTISRNRVWKNDETLISNDMPALQNCARAHNYYADILQKKLKSNYDLTTETKMIEAYEKSIAISKESYYAFIGLGNYYKQNAKFEKAIQVYLELSNLYPKQADPHYYLGDCYYQTENYSKALFHLQKSLELAPNVLSTYYSLSLTQSKLGNYTQALKVITEAKTKFGESSSICEALGMIYYDAGDLEKSTQHTLQMINYGADMQLVYKIVIGRYQFKKQDSMAAYYYKQALNKGLFRTNNR